MKPVLYDSGLNTVDGSNTSQTWDLPSNASGYPAIEFGDVTSLTGSVSVSYDGTNFVDVDSVDSKGNAVARGLSVSASDGLLVYFAGVRPRAVRFTRTAGSGPVRLVTAHDATGEIAARMLQLLGNDGSVKVQASDSPSTDAFGRLRVSNGETIFDSKLVNLDDGPLFWDEQLESGGGITASTPTAAKPYIDFTSTASTAGVFTRQTFRRFNYQPGKSQLIFMTGVLDLSGGGTGVERRIGYFDDDNGLFFEDDADTIGVTVRSNDSGTPSDTTTAQSSWNLDTLDGSGDANNPSGVTADWTKTQIFVIDFQWLAVGRVRFGVEIDGQIIYVHQTGQSNTSAIPWASTPCLPLRYQIVTTASSPASTMRCICATVISEGGTDDIGILRHRSTAGTQVDMTTEDTLYAIKGIRLKSTHLGTTVKIEKTAVSLQSASDDIEWVLIFDPTIAASPSWGDVANSSVQVFTGATAHTVTGGTHIDAGYVSTGTANSASGEAETSTMNALLLGSAINGTAQTIVLCARPINGSSTNVLVEGGITWRELT